MKLPNAEGGRLLFKTLIPSLVALQGKILGQQVMTGKLDAPLTLAQDVAFLGSTEQALNMSIEHGAQFFSACWTKNAPPGADSTNYCLTPLSALKNILSFFK